MGAGREELHVNWFECENGFDMRVNGLGFLVTEWIELISQGSSQATVTDIRMFQKAEGQARSGHESGGRKKKSINSCDWSVGGTWKSFYKAKQPMRTSSCFRLCTACLDVDPILRLHSSQQWKENKLWEKLWHFVVFKFLQCNRGLFHLTKSPKVVLSF